MNMVAKIGMALSRTVLDGKVDSMTLGGRWNPEIVNLLSMGGLLSQEEAAGGF